jgi:hypothetical protein
MEPASDFGTSIAVPSTAPLEASLKEIIPVVAPSSNVKQAKLGIGPIEKPSVQHGDQLCEVLNNPGALVRPSPTSSCTTNVAPSKFPL